MHYNGHCSFYYRSQIISFILRLKNIQENEKVKTEETCGQLVKYGDGRY